MAQKLKKEENLCPNIILLLSKNKRVNIKPKDDTQTAMGNLISFSQLNLESNT